MVEIAKAVFWQSMDALIDRRRASLYQYFVSGVELLQDLIHDGVGEM